MKKHSRIGLMVLVTVVLLLALSIPVLAGPQGTKCQLTWRVHIEDEDYMWEVPGNIAVLSLEGSTLTKTCTGNIPLDKVFGDLTYYSLDEMRGYLCETFSGEACNIGEPFTIGPDETGGRVFQITYKNFELNSFDWELVVQDNGKFEWMSLYTIE